MKDRNYGGLIWTNHAIQRLNERGISQGDAWAVWNRPDQSRYSTTKGAWIYYRTWNNIKIEVVAKQNEKKEWIILSVWSKTLNSLNTQTYKGVSLLTKILNLFKVK